MKKTKNTPRWFSNKKHKTSQVKFQSSHVNGREYHITLSPYCCTWLVLVSSLTILNCLCNVSSVISSCKQQRAKQPPSPWHKLLHGNVSANPRQKFPLGKHPEDWVPKVSGEWFQHEWRENAVVSVPCRSLPSNSRCRRHPGRSCVPHPSNRHRRIHRGWRPLWQRLQANMGNECETWQGRRYHGRCHLWAQLLVWSWNFVLPFSTVTYVWQSNQPTKAKGPWHVVSVVLQHATYCWCLGRGSCQTWTPTRRLQCRTQPASVWYI